MTTYHFVEVTIGDGEYEYSEPILFKHDTHLTLDRAIKIYIAEYHTNPEEGIQTIGSIELTDGRILRWSAKQITDTEFNVMRRFLCVGQACIPDMQRVALVETATGRVIKQGETIRTEDNCEYTFMFLDYIQFNSQCCIWLFEEQGHPLRHDGMGFVYSLPGYKIIEIGENQ